MDLKRQVKVKTGVVKRLRKELAMYEQEKVQNDKRVEDMRASGADVYDVRQAVGVVTPTPPPPPTSPLLSSRLPAAIVPSFPLTRRPPRPSAVRSSPAQERVADESAMMIPDCKVRFEAAIQDLQSLTVSARGPLFSLSSARTQRVWSPSAASAPSP